VRYITGSTEQPAAFSCRTKDIWTRFFDHVCNISEVDDRDIQSRPFINPEAKTDGFSGDRQP
jgi:hypothetical protein